MNDELISRCCEEGARLAMLSPDEIAENYKTMLHDPDYKAASPVVKSLVRRFTAISLSYSRNAEMSVTLNEKPASNEEVII